MLDTLITSKTRVKLLLKFFLNSNNAAYLRSLSGEFGESTNAIRGELNRFEEAGLLESFLKGNKKMYQANVRHPLFNDIHNLLLKHTGIDQVIERILNNIGDLEQAWVVGDFARGKDSPIIDLLLAGKNIDIAYLSTLIEKTETLIHRRIRYIILNGKEVKENLKTFTEALLLFKR
ncbi:MAG: ArsR family transcriptional regulator [Bacteroidia bacterium]|nr:ArsR family transcriptional regulator [Bacteroidia bacterium]